jgi:hypothetical protein
LGIDLENRALDFVARAAEAASAAGVPFAVWAPEDLGDVGAAAPASFWQTEFATDIGKLPNALRAAFCACTLGQTLPHAAFGLLANFECSLQTRHVG